MKKVSVPTTNDICPQTLFVYGSMNENGTPNFGLFCWFSYCWFASTAEGYGCALRVPLGNEGEYAREVLGFPNDYFMPCFIGIGRPKADADVVKQKDITVKDRIHWDIW